MQEEPEHFSVRFSHEAFRARVLPIEGRGETHIEMLGLPGLVGAGQIHANCGRANAVNKGNK